MNYLNSLFWETLSDDHTFLPKVYLSDRGLKLRIFFQGAQLDLHKGFVYIKQYIFGLPAEIGGSHRSIQGSPGFPAPPNFEPCTTKHLIIPIYLNVNNITLIFVILDTFALSLFVQGKQYCLYV